MCFTENDANSSSTVSSPEKTSNVFEKYNPPQGKVTMTKKRQQEGDPGPKKDVIVNIPNFKSGQSITRKVGTLFFIQKQLRSIASSNQCIFNLYFFAEYIYGYHN